METYLFLTNTDDEMNISKSEGNDFEEAKECWSPELKKKSEKTHNLQKNKE